MLAIARMRAVGALLLLAACGYRGGAFSDPLGNFGDTRRTVGCLDVGVQVHHDETRSRISLPLASNSEAPLAPVTTMGSPSVPCWVKGCQTWRWSCESKSRASLLRFCSSFMAKA